MTSMAGGSQPAMEFFAADMAQFTPIRARQGVLWMDYFVNNKIGKDLQKMT